MKKRLKAKLERAAIAICNRHLGSMRRGRQTLDALTVALALKSLDGRRDRIFNYLYEDFYQYAYRHVPLTFIGPDNLLDEDALENDTQDLWDEMEPVFQIAWSELGRRWAFGQDVEGKLAKLSVDLVNELTLDWGLARGAEIYAEYCRSILKRC